MLVPASQGARLLWQRQDCTWSPAWPRLSDASIASSSINAACTTVQLQRPGAQQAVCMQARKTALICQQVGWHRIGQGPWLTWHIMWQGGRAMSGMAAGFQADRMMRLSLGLVRSLCTT